MKKKQIYILCCSIVAILVCLAGVICFKNHNSIDYNYYHRIDKSYKLLGKASSFGTKNLYEPAININSERMYELTENKTYEFNESFQAENFLLNSSNLKDGKIVVLNFENINGIGKISSFLYNGKTSILDTTLGHDLLAGLDRSTYILTQQSYLDSKLLKSVLEEYPDSYVIYLPKGISDTKMENSNYLLNISVRVEQSPAKMTMKILK